MSLSAGSGPFGKHPAGRFNVAIEPGVVLFWDPVPQRIRALVDGEPVLDTARAALLHETGRLPVYYFPLDDVDAELLEPSETLSRCPHKGEARYWSIRVGERRAPDALWAYPEPLGKASFLAGHAALDWDSVDEWFAEEEQLHGHPRDPYHRIDVYRTTRHVRVLLDDELLADSRRACALFETGLPPRWYLPADDVRTDLLRPSSTKTRCAYKGSASYWNVCIEDEVHADLVWTYADPEHDAEQVRDLLCFYDEKVDVELDGRRNERPSTQWS